MTVREFPPLPNTRRKVLSAKEEMLGAVVGNNTPLNWLVEALLSSSLKELAEFPFTADPENNPVTVYESAPKLGGFFTSIELAPDASDAT